MLDAAERGEPTIVTRHGKPVAALVPMAAYEAAKRQASILPLAGTGRGMWGKDSRRFIRKLRDEWER